MMDCLYIFLFMLHFSAGCDLVQHMSQTLDVTGYLGESVVLPCYCTEPQAKPHQLKWKSHGKNGVYEMYPEHIETYKNRVTLLNQTTPGNLSLLLSSLTKEDDGDYKCSVSPDQYTFIRLHVKGCDMVRQTLEVTGYSGESVVLPCYCTEPQAKPHQLKWKYEHQGDYKEMYPSEHIETYKNRVTLLNQTTPGNLSLLLSSLTKEDDGDYHCSVSPDQLTFIRLHVKEKPDVNTNKLSTSKPLTTQKQTPELNKQPTENMPQYVFILMGVFALVLLLALLAFIYWRWKGGKNVKVTRDDPEIVREPNNEPSTILYEPKKELSTHLYEPINEFSTNLYEPKNEDDVTYSAVVHVKRSSIPASTQNDKVDDMEYASVNAKQT